MKKCRTCGKEFYGAYGDAITTCPDCGTPVELVDEQPGTPVRKKISILTVIQIVLCICGMVLGIIVICQGCDLYNYCDRVQPVRFGGDFYTEIHDAACRAANNIDDLANLNQDIGEMLGFAAGGSMIVGFGLKLLDTILKVRKEEKK